MDGRYEIEKVRHKVDSMESTRGINQFEELHWANDFVFYCSNCKSDGNWKRNLFDAGNGESRLPGSEMTRRKMSCFSLWISIEIRSKRTLSVTDSRKYRNLLTQPLFDWRFCSMKSANSDFKYWRWFGSDVASRRECRITAGFWSSLLSKYFTVPAFCNSSVHAAMENLIKLLRQDSCLLREIRIARSHIHHSFLIVSERLGYANVIKSSNDWL